MIAVRTYLVVLLAAAATTSTIKKASDYCYADITDPYIRFGSKTAYEFIHPSNTTVENIPNCEPIQIWMLSRHGTRFPSKSEIKAFQGLYELRDDIFDNHKSRKRVGKLCQKDLDNLKTWSFNVSADQNKFLAPQGEEDLRKLALRLKQKFPTLLGSPYSQDIYQFRYTNKQRTQASAEKFVEGLFGSIEGVYFPPALDYDPLIKDYSNCSKWVNEIEGNDDALAEAVTFKKGDEVNAVKKAVTKRLGFDDKLKFKKVDAMYSMCGSDKAWNVNQLSPWCAVFTEDELKVLEYYEDLTAYYENGYGHQINIDLGCPPVKDFMDRFSELAEGNLKKSQQPAGVFYFTHSHTLQMVQARLGVYKDSEPLLASNYAAMNDRQWRLSKMGTFATNIEAVFYRCTEGDENRVKFYESEMPMEIEGCDGGLCSWEVVKEKFSSVADQCNLDFCNS